MKFYILAQRLSAARMSMPRNFRAEITYVKRGGCPRGLLDYTGEYGSIYLFHNLLIKLYLIGP